MATNKLDDSWFTETITITGPSGIDTLDNMAYSSVDYINTPTTGSIDLSGLNANGSFTIGGATGSAVGGIYTIGSGTNGTWPNTIWSTNTAANLTQSGKISLTGKEADIEINGESLMKMLAVFKERLGWLQPNPDMEAEWDELRELGERYRELEKKCKEKGEMWNKLKSMPPPQVG